MRKAWIFYLMVLAASRALAAAHEVRLPLHDGKLHVGDLNAALCRQWRLPPCRVGGDVDIIGAGGREFLTAVNACLADGWSLSAARDAVVLHTDDADRPDRCEAAWRAVRVYAAESNPRATAAQARNWGLLLPTPIDPSRRLIVLIHGLDADRGDCVPMGELLRRRGCQVAYFGYPGDQPIADDVRLLAREMRALRSVNPGMSIDIIAHSMGGLVARAYVEGPDYAGGVDHLVLVGTPNHGSNWARFRMLLSAQQNYRLHRDDPHWSWSWVITEGLGQAGADLRPGSDFLNRLNGRPRRAGVKYTIIAGSRSGVQRAEANWVECISQWVPRRTRNWWGFRQCYGGLHHKATRLRNRTGDSDGPVSIASARLDGVGDLVVVPADHVGLFMSSSERIPAAYPIVMDRLSR